MLNHGVPAIIVSKRLRHYKVSMTLDIYGHLISEMQNNAAEIIDELISPIAIPLHTVAHENDDAKNSPYNTPQIKRSTALFYDRSHI